ncbi:MAG: glycosyltransferase [Candidatus Dormiibacterota bacterium]
MTQRHVVIVAPPWYPIPPNGYGGIELVVGLLGDALRQQGDRVTLLAAEGSEPGAIVLAPRSWQADLGGPDERLRELTYASRVATTLTQLERIDVIHDHCGFATLVAACAANVAPVVHTVHGDIPEAYATSTPRPSITRALWRSARRSAEPCRISGGLAPFTTPSMSTTCW